MNATGPAAPPPGVGVVTDTLAVPEATTSDAGIAAFICVVLTNVVVLGLPFHWTTVHGTRELPVTLRVNAGEPAGTEVAVPTGGFKLIKLCESEIMLGGGRLVPGVVIVNAAVFDGPDGAETDTPAVPGNAASEGRIAAVSLVELTKVVARAEPFVELFAPLVQFTTESLVKFVPFTVKVKPVGLQ